METNRKVEQDRDSWKEAAEEQYENRLQLEVALRERTGAWRAADQLGRASRYADEIDAILDQTGIG